jgi:hypothetical protein
MTAALMYLPETVHPDHQIRREDPTRRTSPHYPINPLKNNGEFLFGGDFYFRVF